MTHVQPHLNDSDATSVDSSADENSAAGALLAPDAAVVSLRSAQSSASSFGDRLRTAREARGEDLDTVSRALRLPLRVLRQLEADTYNGTDSKVYLAGYINSYARYLGVDAAEVQGELDRIRQVEAPLVATGGISRSRFLLDRYTTAATYVVLTAVFVVPMVWLGMRGSLDRDLSRMAPLDATPVAQQDAPPASASSAAVVPTFLHAPRDVSVALPQQSLMASMAPFPNLDDTQVNPPVVPATPDVAGAGAHSMSLSLNAASWVEVIGKDGSRMEYGLLPAGSSRTYRSDQPLDVRIGNASGAQLSIDGKAVSLGDFQHSNVARLQVLIEDGQAKAASL
ncbi:MAG: RodZ domain-containing protein [Rhodanobacter sp.]